MSVPPGQAHESSRGAVLRRRCRHGSGLVAGLALLGLVAAACSGGSQAAVTVTVAPTAAGAVETGVVVPGLDGPAATSSSTQTTVSSDGSTLRTTISPKDGATDVAPNNPVTVTAFGGKLASVTLTGADGSTVAGAVSSDGSTWTSSARLNYNTKYTFGGQETPTKGGDPVPVTGSFTTVNPTTFLTTEINIPDGDANIGIAAPIIITFDGQVANKAEVEKAMTVTTSAGSALQGSWGWMQDEDFQSSGHLQSQAHWRPTVSPAPVADPSGKYGSYQFWPAGTKVTLQLNFKGVDYGNGAWGKIDKTSSFTIRPQQTVVIADSSSFHLVVQQDGKTVKNYPVSYGKDSGYSTSDDPTQQRATVNGPHVVMDKQNPYTMCNKAFGYCGVTENWAVRINQDGEFIHENASVAQYLGKANVSHGCVNMGAADAQDFYTNIAMYGDPVLVYNSGGPDMNEQDAFYDWIYTPDDWKQLSAISG